MHVIRPIESILETAKNRPANYVERMHELSTVQNGKLVFTAQNYLKAVAEFSPEAYAAALTQLEPHLPQPLDKWPLWTLPVRLAKAKDDAGIGDTIERVVGPFGGDAFKAWHLLIFGIPCGCSERQADWNYRYPYDHY